MNDIKSFAEGVEYIARQVAESTPRDITQRGRITAVAGTGLYDVIINGKSYASVPTYPSGSTSLAVNDMVWNICAVFII